MKFLPALLLPFIPWVLHQASSALVDLIMAALLIAALAFGHEYRSSRRRLDAAAAGLSLGLACGVKFVTLAYLPLVILPVLSAFIARRDGRAFLAFSLTGLLAGAPWYVRNAWLTGNPLFPMDVSLFGHAILRGAYTRQSLMASALHVRGGWAVVAVATHAVGLWFSVVCIAGIVAGLFYCRRRAEWRSLAWIAPVGLAWHFLVVPYSSQDRFLIWIAALSLLPLALWPDTGKGRLWLGFFLAALVGTSLAYPRIYWQWGSIQASTNPLVSTDAVALRQMALVALIVALARYALLAKTWRGTVVATVAVGIASTFVRPVMFVRPMNANIPMVLPIAGYIRLLREHPNAVAYSGHNAPYLLAGASGRTRVVYVNIDGLRNKHLYDYVRDAAAAGQRAAANGEPDRDRRNPSFQAWRAAMVDLGIQYLFVEPMSPSGAADIGRDSDGFPVERAWARGHPEAFRPVASDRKWEIYAVLPPGN